VKGVGSTEPAIFLEFQLTLGRSLILCRCIVAALALAAGQRNNNSHSSLLLDYFADDAGPYRTAPFSDGKTQLLFHRYRGDQLRLNRHVISRHHHLRPLR